MKLFVEKATLGRNRLVTGGDDHDARDEVRSLEQDLLAHRTQVSSAADRVVKLNELLSVLKKYATAESKKLRWRVRFACLCVDVIKRRDGILETEGNEGKYEYQRKREMSAIMLNNIVSKLAPCLEAYALALFLVVEAANYSYYDLGQRSRERRQKCTILVAQELLKMDIRVRRDQLWFHPGALISWFVGDRYSEICEALGLGVFADSYLDKEGMGDDVPWASPLGPLFTRKPAQSGRIGGDELHNVLNPRVHARQVEAPPDPNVSLDLPRKHRRVYGPDTGMKDELDQILALGGTPHSALSQNARKPPMFDRMTLLLPIYKARLTFAQHHRLNSFVQLQAPPSSQWRTF